MRCDLCVLFLCFVYFFFFFSSRRRHTRYISVTGVQTCALPICCASGHSLRVVDGRELYDSPRTVSQLRAVDHYS